MEHQLINKLKALSMPTWFSRSAGSLAAIEELEQEYNIRLPEDYRLLLLYSNGGSLGGEAGSFNYESIEDLMWHNLDERFEEHLPGMFVIGDNGGGSVYFYDPENKLGHGSYALFLVPLGALRFDYAVFAGQSLTEVMNGILLE